MGSVREAVSSPAEVPAHQFRTGRGPPRTEDREGEGWLGLDASEATCPYKLAEVAARFV